MKKLFSIKKGSSSLLYPTLLFCLSLLTAASFAQSIDTSYYYRITNTSQEGKSLAISYDGTTNRPALHTTAEVPMQYWKLALNKYGSYRITNQRLGSGLSVQVDKDKIKLTIGTNTEGAGQAWKINSNRDGTYRVTSVWLGAEQSVDLVHDDSKNELFLGTTGKEIGQFWKLTKLPKPVVQVQPVQVPVNVKPLIDTAFLYHITNVWQAEKSLEVVNDAARTLHPMLKTTQENPAQYWKFILTANGFYRIINQKYGVDKSLDIINDGQNNKTILTANADVSGQYWKILDNRDGSYRISSMWQGNRKSLDVINDGIHNNVPTLGATANYSGQLWKFNKAILPPPVVEAEEMKPIIKEEETKSVVKEAVVVAAIIEQQNTTPIIKDRLLGGEELMPNMKLVSKNGKHTMVLQGDGNLVVYNDEDHARWASDTQGQKITKCKMQKDGNLVMYLANNVATWSSNTHGNPGAYIVMQDNGNLVIYRKDNQPLWSTNTEADE